MRFKQSKTVEVTNRIVEVATLLCNTVRHNCQWPGFEPSNAGNIKQAAPYDVESGTSCVASSVPAKNSGRYFGTKTELAQFCFCSKIAVGSRLSNITISSHEAKI